MSPLLSTFQPLPMLPMPLLTPGGATPFVLTDGLTNVLAADVPSVVPLAMTAAENGPHITFDCTMPVSVAEEPVTDPASAPPPSPVPVAVPAAALLASLDRSARALVAPPPIATLPRSATMVSTAGKGDAPATPDRHLPEDTPTISAHMREPVALAMDPAPMASMNPLLQPVDISTPRQTSSAPVPGSAATVSMTTGSSAVFRPTLPVTVASIAAEPREIEAAASKISGLPSQLIAAKPATHRLPTQDNLPVAVSVGVVQAMQVDGLRRAGPSAVRAPSHYGAEPFVSPIFVTRLQDVATADGAAIDGFESARSDAANSASIAVTVSTGVAQPAVGQVSGVELLASLTSSDIATIDRQLDLARGDAWLDTLARDITASADGNSRLRFGLSPERLGKLDVEVSRGDAGLSVTMTTRSEEARIVIAAAQPRLIEELRAQGTRVVSADVSAQTGEQSGSAPRPQVASIIEAVVETRASASDAITRTTADGRYA